MKALFARRVCASSISGVVAQRMGAVTGKDSAALEGTLAYPMFVKPAIWVQVWVSKALDQAQLNVATKAAAYDRRLIVEQGWLRARSSAVCWGQPRRSIPKSFTMNLWTSNGYGSELLIPAPLADDVVAEVQKLAIKAFRAIDCSGMARVDFFLEKDSGRVLVNEINTIPGFTAISMYPKLWEASGLSYRDLLTRLLTLGWERFQDRSRLRTSYN